MAFLAQFKQSYLLVPVAIIIAIAMIFADSKLTKKPVDKRIYLKSALGVGLISFFIIYIHTLKGKIDEEIIGGIPPF